MSAIVSEARTWIGVKFVHQGRNRFGVDCAGLPWCVYDALGVRLDDWRAYAHEARSDELVRRLTDALGDPVTVAPISRNDVQPGDIALFKFHLDGAAHHVGILTGPTFIDADGMAGKVVERRLSDKYLSRITHLFRRPV